MANLKEQLEAFENGRIIDSQGEENLCHNFYDWFCKDSSLQPKAIKLFKQLKQFLKVHPEIDLEKTYCFFKNNCPMVGSLYDDFRICDVETGNVIFTVIPKSGHKSQDFPAEIWGSENGFEGPMKKAKTWKELLQ